MNKQKINLVTEALMFLCMAAVAGIGVLIKFVLLPGQESWQVYGRNVDLLFMGMNRHQWGTIHMTIAGIFLLLLVGHIVLHWKTVRGMYRNLLQNNKARWVVGIVFLSICLALLLFAWAVEPEVVERGRGKAHGHRHSDARTISILSSNSQSGSGNERMV